MKPHLSPVGKPAPPRPRSTESLSVWMSWSWNQRTPAGLKQSIIHFQHAIELDPGYAEAYSGLADAYTALGYTSYWAPQDSFPKAREFADKALQIDPSLAEARTSLAYVKLYYDWDWKGAEEKFQQAITVNPNYATAHHWYSVL